MRPVRLRVLVESGEKHRPTCVYILSMKLKRSRKKNSHITVNILLIIGRTEPRLIRQRCETNWLENGRSAISQRWVAWNSGLWKIAPKSWERKAMFCVWRLLPYFFHLLLPPVRPWDSWLFFCWCLRATKMLSEDSPCCFLVGRCAANIRTRSSPRSSRETFSTNLCGKCSHGLPPATSNWNTEPRIGRSHCWRHARVAHWILSNPFRVVKFLVPIPLRLNSFSWINFFYCPVGTNENKNTHKQSLLGRNWAISPRLLISLVRDV